MCSDSFALIYCELSHAHFLSFYKYACVSGKSAVTIRIIGSSSTDLRADGDGRAAKGSTRGVLHSMTTVPLGTVVMQHPSDFFSDPNPAPV